MIHTPGPWKITKEDVGDEDFIIIPTGIEGANGKTVVGSVGGLCSEDCDLKEGELEANANLIAAAPELLEALARISGMAHDYDQLSDVEETRFAEIEQIASEVIKKARGEA